MGTMLRNLALPSLSALALCVAACGGTGSSQTGPISDDDSGMPSDGGSKASDAGASDAKAGDAVTLTFDGKNVGAKMHSCLYTQDSTYRTMECKLDTDDGNTITVSYLSAAGSGFAPLGSVEVPRQDNVLVTVEMMETGKVPYSTEEDVPWSGKGTLTLTATGEGGKYAGSAKGVFSRNNPFSSKPPPSPIDFALSFSTTTNGKGS